MAPPTVHLMSWPPRHEPLRTWIVAGLEIATAVIAAYSTERWAMGLLVFGLLLVASWPLWLPVRFELGAKGIFRGVLGWRRRISWTEFSRYETYTHGVFLCHHSNQQPFAAVSGLFLPSKPPHAELLPVLDYYLRPRDDEPVPAA